MQKTDRNFTLYLLHIFGSLLFLSIPILLYPNLGINITSSERVLFNIIFFRYVLMLLFFYANYFYFLPKLYFKRRKTWYCIATTISFFLIGVGPGFLLNSEKKEKYLNLGTRLFENPENKTFTLFDDGYIITFLLILFFGLLLKVNQRRMYAKNVELKTQLSYLTAQLEPHFLFNTLNSIYALTLEKSDNAPEAVLKLSEMMRYVVTESGKERVSLTKEIEYLENYVSLQKLRLGNEISLNFLIKGNFIGKSISPLILIPFVENAFIHGINPEQDSKIAISLSLNSNNLQLKVSYNKVPIDNAIQDNALPSLQNVKDRLQYLYPNKHILRIFEDKTSHNVILSINLV